MLVLHCRHSSRHNEYQFYRPISRYPSRPKCWKEFGDQITESAACHLKVCIPYGSHKANLATTPPPLTLKYTVHECSRHTTKSDQAHVPYLTYLTLPKVARMIPSRTIVTLASLFGTQPRKALSPNNHPFNPSKIRNTPQPMSCLTSCTVFTLSEPTNQSIPQHNPNIPQSRLA